MLGAALARRVSHRPAQHGAMPRFTGKRILILDADGVLLRLPGGEALESLDLIEDLLRDPDMADVRVVATGEWKRHLGLAQIRRLFAEDLRERFVDTTPEVEGSDGFRPHVEIHAWLAAHPEIADYVVLESGYHWTRSPALESAMFIHPPQGVLDAPQAEVLKRHFACMA
jgi:hypothetical protein